MSATSGVPSLSAKASAAGPSMNSCGALPTFLISNVTVSPWAAVTTFGKKDSWSSATRATTRGVALVPGTKPSVGEGAGVLVGAGVAEGADTVPAGPEVVGSGAIEELDEGLVEPHAASAADTRSRPSKRRVRARNGVAIDGSS